MGSGGIWNISIWLTGQLFVTSTKHVATITKDPACINPKQISLVTQRAILRDAQKQHAKKCLTADMETANSTDTALRQYIIKRQPGYYAENRV